MNDVVRIEQERLHVIDLTLCCNPVEFDGFYSVDERWACALISEPVLAKDWNRPEEDEAWAHLQPEVS